MNRKQQFDQETQAALATSFDPDAPGTEVVSGPRQVTIVHSTRLPSEYSKALEEEAERRGINPSKLMQLFVISALEAARGGDIVHIPRQRLLEALERAVNTAA
jgi:hypothetical protein